jgi:hypothetical protein
MRVEWGLALSLCSHSAYHWDCKASANLYHDAVLCATAATANARSKAREHDKLHWLRSGAAAVLRRGQQQQRLQEPQQSAGGDAEDVALIGGALWKVHR